MSDTSGIGSRIDAAIQRARTALDGLRQQLSAKAAEIGQEINTTVDEIQAAIDELQAARQADQGQPTQLPANPAGQTATQQAAGGVSGGTAPPA